MKYLEIAKLLNKKHKGKIVLIKTGIFFVAVGNSALALEKLFPLKRICMTYEMCKVGIPIVKIDEYVKKLLEMSVPIVLYDYVSKPLANMLQYEKILETEGINKHDVERECCDCVSCESLPKFMSNMDLSNIKLLENLKETVKLDNYKDEQITFFGEDNGK